MAVWSFPTRIVFGEGTVDEAGTEARKLGARSALVVSDPGVMNAGLVDRVVRSLEKEGVLSTPFTEVSAHPTEAGSSAGATWNRSSARPCLPARTVTALIVCEPKSIAVALPIFTCLPAR